MKRMRRPRLEKGGRADEWKRGGDEVTRVEEDENGEGWIKKEQVD